MLKKKAVLSQIKDNDKGETMKKVLRTVPYKHSESIQEEEEHSSLSQLNVFGHHKPNVLTCPQQPIDYQGSEDLRPPTLITNIISNKSNELIGFKSESRRRLQPNYLEEADSKLSSSVNSMRSIIDRRKTQVNFNKVKLLVEQIKNKLLNSIHYSKYNDPLVMIEQQELSPLKYHYYTLYHFLLTVLSNILSCICIPIASIFNVSYHFQLATYIICGLTLFQIFQDFYFQRGPYKMIRGQIKQNYRDESKRFIDIIRFLLICITGFFSYDHPIKIVLLILMMITQIIRQNEDFENIYKSITHFIVVIQLWTSIIISLACLYQVISIDEDIPISFCITLAISILTHSSNIIVEVNDSNSTLLSIYMIISYLCLVYTSTLLFIWIKPDLEIEEEKQKLLKGFIKKFRQKCQNDGLLRRCYSYLEFRIDEDLDKQKDQLTKKLSPELEDEIDISIRSTMIDKIELMNRFSPHFKQQLLYEIEQVTFNPEDNIIIEHQVEDLGLYYILKGQVKVQFQGSSLGNNKRSVTTLQEGQTFGQYSFITGIPSNISIFSCGVTVLMKLKRSDFTQTISNYPLDNEIFCKLKDNAFYNAKLFECYYCKIRGNYIQECRHIQYFPQRLNVIEKHLYTVKQVRRKFERRLKKHFAWQELSLNESRAREYNNKQSYNATDELPEASQLPFSENQTHSVSYVSNSLAQRNYSPDYPQSASNVNVDSLDQLNIDQEYQDETLPLQDTRGIRKTQNKTTLRTAGFPGNFDPGSQGPSNNITISDNNDKEIFQQSLDTQGKQDKTVLYNTGARNNIPNQLTFLYQKQTSSQLFLKDDQIKTDSYQIQNQFNQTQLTHQTHGTIKQSQRQVSNRSYTYSNSLSKDISGGASSNSKQKLQQQQSQNKVMDQQGTKKINSERSLTEQVRMMGKSMKSGTKNSTPNQMSQFQALTAPENQGYYINDILFNQFERMNKFKIYQPHNNYDNVIQRYIKFLEINQLISPRKKKQIKTTPYSIKCFVSGRIKKVKKLLLTMQN